MRSSISCVVPPDLQLLRPAKPNPCAGVAGHPPIPPGAQAHGAHLHPVGQAAALELLAHEPAIEGFQPFFDGFPVKIPGKRLICQVENLLGGVAEPQDVVEEEVVEGVGAYDAFGLLGDFAVLVRGQQLGADGGVQNVPEDGGAVRENLKLHQRVDHPADQRLGDGGVHAVHTHMVGVIGAPAQSQFAQVAGAHHQTADFARVIHQHLGPLPGLGILKGQVGDGLVVAQIAKMLLHRCGDGDGHRGNAQGFHQLQRVVVGTIRGAEAGHGDADYVGLGPPQLPHGFHRHQQGQGGIETAGHADHRLGMGDGETLFEPRHLHLEDIPAPSLTIRTAGGDEGQLGDGVQVAVGPFLILGQVEAGEREGLDCGAVHPGAVGKAAVFHAVGANSSQVDVHGQYIIRV